MYSFGKMMDMDSLENFKGLFSKWNQCFNKQLMLVAQGKAMQISIKGCNFRIWQSRLKPHPLWLP